MMRSAAPVVRRWRTALVALVSIIATALLVGTPALLKSGSAVRGMMPHGYCLRWQPGLLFMHVGSDLAIGLSYFTISALLLVLVRKHRQQIPFGWVFVAFGAFIVACGVGHLVDIWTLWRADYWLSGGVKVTTAIASLVTAALLPRTLPRVSEMIHATRVSEERGEALRRSEQLYRGLFESAHDAILIVDPNDAAILAANPAASKLYGFDGDTILGVRMTDVARDAAACRRTIALTMRNGARTHFETMHRRHDGTELIVEISASVVEYDGRMVLLSINRDVTERHRAAEQIRESEMRLNEAQRIANMACFTFDPATRAFISSGDHFARIFGSEPGAPIPYEDLLAALDDSARGATREANHRLVTEGAAEWKMEVTLANGSMRTIYCVARADRDPDGSGRIVRTIGVVQDISQHEAAAERLRASEERFRLIAQAASEVLWDWNLSESWAWFSAGLTTAFGHARDEREGISIDDWAGFIHPDDRLRVTTGMYAALESGKEEWSDEYRFRRADGSWALVHDRGFIVRDDDRRPTRFVGTMIDVTEERKLAEQLQRSQRVDSLGRVATSIAHEFNNVLMGIQPNIEVLGRRKDPAIVKKALELIANSVHRGKRVTDDILQFTRPVSPALTHVAITEMIESWRREMAPVLPASVRLHVDAAGTGNAQINADCSKLAQVLTNLAVNAADAMPDGGNLTVAAHLTAEGSEVRIDVTDDGVGMSPEEMARVFEPLYTTKRRGTGLGLPISFQIVAAHHGQLLVESERGKGSTFTIVLPVSKPAVTVPASSPEPALERPRRVLLVEDELSVAIGLQWLLEEEGIIVEMVHLGGEAVGCIERNRPDVVILDVGLPDVDGTDVFNEIRRRWPNLPVLFSSGHAGAAALEKLLTAKHTHLLLKPYALAALQTALQGVITA
jgi:PAS domain S-box-containing protein